jgi:hypothetical protein
MRTSFPTQSYREYTDWHITNQLLYQLSYASIYTALKYMRKRLNNQRCFRGGSGESRRWTGDGDAFRMRRFNISTKTENAIAK